MNSSQLIRKILPIAKPYWFHIGGLFFLNLLSTPISLLKPVALSILIDSGFGSHAVPEFVSMFFPDSFVYSFDSVLIISIVMLVVVAVLDNIHGIIVWLLDTYTGEKLVLCFRTHLFNHIQRISLAYHDRKGASDSLYRIQWDAMGIRSFLMGQLSPLITASITLISMVIVMFMINWRFAVIALCVIPPLYILTRLSTKKLKKEWKKVKNDESVALSVVHEVLGALRIVKAFGQESYEQKRFSDQSEKVIKGQLKASWVGSLFNFLVAMVFTTGTALFIYIGAKYVKSGEMTLGELTIVIAYLGQIFGPLQSISKNLNGLQSSLISIERVFSVLEEKKEVVELQDAIHLGKSKGEFEFKNVSFSYEKATNTLQDISFEVRSGDRVGIIGTTGAGKSTLISLLMRFYDPEIGKILIDGEDVRKYKISDYRSQFSIVLQEPVLFSTTIAENIRYGKPGASDKQVVDAAIAANAHNFITRHKDGYEAMVGDRGVQLSGGERQRISLARAFIKDAPVLILDEPTSALDLRTEALIMEAMERLMAGRTTFMITHRLDSLKSCNLILHLEQGKLLEAVRDYDSNYINRKKSAFLQEA